MKNTSKWNRAIAEGISLLFIVLFVYASITKLLDYEKFAVQMGQSPMLTKWAEQLAWLVPTVELCTVGLLLFSNSKLVGLYVSVSLMVMFTVYILLASKFSDYVPCSCGGVLQNMTWDQHLVFNLFFVASGMVAVIRYPQQQPTT